MDMPEDFGYSAQVEQILAQLQQPRMNDAPTYYQPVMDYGNQYPAHSPSYYDPCEQYSQDWSADEWHSYKYSSQQQFAGDFQEVWNDQYEQHREYQQVDGRASGLESMLNQFIQESKSSQESMAASFRNMEAHLKQISEHLMEQQTSVTSLEHCNSTSAERSQDVLLCDDDEWDTMKISCIPVVEEEKIADDRNESEQEAENKTGAELEEGPEIELPKVMSNPSPIPEEKPMLETPVSTTPKKLGREEASNWFQTGMLMFEDLPTQIQKMHTVLKQYKEPNVVLEWLLKLDDP